jgi:hypothetical protein
LLSIVMYSGTSNILATLPAYKVSVEKFLPGILEIPYI